MKFFNTTEQNWDNQPYMIKEHTVIQDGYAATVVVVPFARRNKKGEDTGNLVFIPMGVRIENLNTRLINGDYLIPGYTFFYKFSTQKISESSTWRFKTDRLGNPFMKNGLPEVTKPTQKFAGVEMERFRMNEKFSKLITLAQESYAAFREAQRAAA